MNWRDIGADVGELMGLFVPALFPVMALAAGVAMIVRVTEIVSRMLDRRWPQDDPAPARPPLVQYAGQTAYYNWPYEVTEPAARCIWCEGEINADMLLCPHCGIEVAR
jgi:hypothetical protein